MAAYAQIGLAPVLDGFPPELGPIDMIPTPLQSYYGALGGLTLFFGVMLLIGGLLSRIFTVLATVITISVMLGCMALVIVLSLMTGLEHDLRDKILGQRAHIRVSREDGKPFADYLELTQAIAAEPGITGASPYLQGEVMVRSGFQRQGGILLGILPEFHRSVSNLPEILQEGEYRFLAEPTAVPQSQFHFELPRPVREPDEPEDPIPDPNEGRSDGVGLGATALPPQPWGLDGGWEDPAVKIPELRAQGKLPPATQVAEPEPDPDGWEDPEIEIAKLRAQGRLAPAVVSAPDLPVAADSEADDGWEDPELEIAKLRAQGDLPPAVASAPDPSVEADSAAENPDENPDGEPAKPEISDDGASEDALLAGVFIGSEKAKELAAHLGDPVQLITPIGRLTPAGRIPGVLKVKVAGVFDANHYEYDRWLLYTELSLAQAFLRAGDRVSGIEIKVDDVDDLVARKILVDEVVARMGRDDLIVQDWQELNRSLFSAMALEKIAVFIALLCVILVASFGILGSNLMSVLEKAKEIAILKTMGCSDREILRVFLAEGLLLGVLGAVLGIVVGIALCLVLDRFGLPLSGNLKGFEELPVAIDALEITLVGVSSLLIVWLSSLYPAWIASRMRPVDALRQAER